jgi:hexokinase
MTATAVITVAVIAALSSTPRVSIAAVTEARRTEVARSVVNSEAGEFASMIPDSVGGLRVHDERQRTVVIYQ